MPKRSEKFIVHDINGTSGNVLCMKSAAMARARIAGDMPLFNMEEK